MYTYSMSSHDQVNKLRRYVVLAWREHQEIIFK